MTTNTNTTTTTTTTTVDTRGKAYYAELSYDGRVQWTWCSDTLYGVNNYTPCNHIHAIQEAYSWAWCKSMDIHAVESYSIKTWNSLGELVYSAMQQVMYTP